MDVLTFFKQGLNAKEYPAFHILGYGFAVGAPALAELCRRMKARRDERADRLLAFLKQRGIDLTASEVEELAGGGIIGRPHFAQAMVRRGYVSTNREAFDRYLDTEEYHQRVECGKPSVQECIEAVKASGGSDFHGEKVKPDIQLAALDLELDWLPDN